MVRHFPLFFYEYFNEILEAAVRAWLGPTAEGLSDRELWEAAAEDAELVAALFPAGVSSRHYLKKKEDWLLRGHDPIPLKPDVLCKALEFLGCQYPEGVNVNGVRAESKLVYLAPQYIKEHWSDNPEYIDILLPLKRQKQIPATSESPLDSTPLSSFQLLDRAVFIAEYTQFTRTDRAVLRLNIKGANEVTGTVHVLYQDEEGKYPQSEEVMVLRGYFHPDDILVYTFHSTDRKHYGVMQLGFNSTQDLEGNYLVYYRPIPKGRLGQKGRIENSGIGEIAFRKSTEKAALDFLNEVRGDEHASYRVDFSMVQRQSTGNMDGR